MLITWCETKTVLLKFKWAFLFSTQACQQKCLTRFTCQDCLWVSQRISEWWDSFFGISWVFKRIKRWTIFSPKGIFLKCIINFGWEKISSRAAFEKCVPNKKWTFYEKYNLCALGVCYRHSFLFGICVVCMPCIWCARPYFSKTAREYAIN